MITLLSDAWADGPISVEVSDDRAITYALSAGEPDTGAGRLGFEPGGDWRQKDVGWGIVVPQHGEVPDVARELIRFRSEEAGWPIPVMTCDPARPTRRLLRSDGSTVGIGSDRGVGRGELPCFLLILASPDEVTWHEQAWMAGIPAAVGRIDPEQPGTETYLAAVANDWVGAASDPGLAITWSMAEEDMGSTMRAALADRVAARLSRKGIGLTRSDGPSPTQEDLLRLLAEAPGLVVTTSHGSLPGTDRHGAELVGRPIGPAGVPLDVEAVAAAAPGGAIWYIHACCSGGTSKPSLLAPIFGAGDAYLSQLRMIEEAGSQIAPLPVALLGAPQPARAVVAQVELTFDWMLVDGAETDVALADRRPVSSGLVDGAASLLTRRIPLGRALADHYAEAGGLLGEHRRALDDFDRADAPEPDEAKRLLPPLLGAYNRQATVLLGDPTVAFPGAPA